MQVDLANKTVLQGHVMDLGRDAGNVKNTGYLDEATQIVWVDCNGIYTQIDCNDWNHIQKINGEICTWYKLTVGYIGAHYKKWCDGIDTIVYLHEHILSKYERKPNSNYSVDHINGDKLDNRRINLRWADQNLQNRNRDKVARKHNARPLPDGLDKIIADCKEQYGKFDILDKSNATAFQLWTNNTENTMPKYIEYCDEVYNKEKGLRRQFFRINKHPSGKSISSSKSANVSIKDKFEDIIIKLHQLEHS